MIADYHIHTHLCKHADGTPEEYLADKDELVALLRQVQEAAEDARMIVRRLRLVNPSSDEAGMQPVDLNAILDSAAKLSRPRWKEQAAIEGRGSIDMVLDLAEPPYPYSESCRGQPEDRPQI